MAPPASSKWGSYIVGQNSAHVAVAPTAPTNPPASKLSFGRHKKGDSKSKPDVSHPKVEPEKALEASDTSITPVIPAAQVIQITPVAPVTPTQLTLEERKQARTEQHRQKIKERMEAEAAEEARRAEDQRRKIEEINEREYLEDLAWQEEQEELKLRMEERIRAGYHSNGLSSEASSDHALFISPGSHQPQEQSQPQPVPPTVLVTSPPHESSSPVTNVSSTPKTVARADRSEIASPTNSVLASTISYSDSPSTVVDAAIVATPASAPTPTPTPTPAPVLAPVITSAPSYTPQGLFSKLKSKPKPLVQNSTETSTVAAHLRPTTSRLPYAIVPIATPRVAPVPTGVIGFEEEEQDEDGFSSQDRRHHQPGNYYLGTPSLRSPASSPEPDLVRHQRNSASPLPVVFASSDEKADRTLGHQKSISSVKTMNDSLQKHGLEKSAVPTLAFASSPSSSADVEKGGRIRQIDTGYPSEPEELTIERSLAHLLIVLPYAMLGFLVRYGLTELGTYAGSSVASLVWSQGVSCVIFGLVMGKRRDLVALYPPLWTGVCVGFAGSVNSFAGWLLQAFLSFANFDGYARNSWQSAMDGIGQILLTLLVASAALSLGLHLANIIPAIPVGSLSKPTRTPWTDRLTALISLGLYAVAVVGYFLFGSVYWRRQLILPLVFAPAGAVLRYVLGFLNPRDRRSPKQATTRKGLSPMRVDRSMTVPVGTFLANMFGTVGLAVCFAMSQLDKITPFAPFTCAAVLAIGTGLAGSMTSLPGLIFEIKYGFRSTIARWIYLFSSVIVGMGIVVGVVGGIWWKGPGFDGVCRFV